MNVVIEPGRLAGTLKVPPSKSFAHRALICAALADNCSVIANCGQSEDIKATVRCLRALGTEITEDGGRVFVKKGLEMSGILNCGESGSTLRFMLPAALVVGGDFVFTGAGRLMKRPLEEYFKIFEEQGIFYKLDKDKNRLEVSGRLRPGRFHLSGGVSSQYLTGLLMALPVLESESEIVLDSPLESSGYVDMTGDIQKLFGVVWEKKENCYYIKGGQSYCACEMQCEGDYSQAAFWLAAQAFGCDIKLEGLSEKTFQPDRVMAELIKNTPEEIDVSQCPDLVPILAVFCALIPGKRRITNAARLRYKESDRLKSVSALINNLGGDIKELADGLEIQGVKCLSGGRCDSFGDHRIAMSAAIAAVKAKEKVVISDAQCVNKSYPEFWTHYKKLGGKADEYEYR